MIWCYGSINIDLFYDVPHIPAPGETLLATSMSRGLGGKGVNQSVAAAKAGAKVRHIGAVGVDGAWCLESLQRLGVDCANVTQSEQPTGHAVITVANDGENAITLLSGANASLDTSTAKMVLAQAKTGDVLLLQNEVNGVAEVAACAKQRGLYVIYSAAPFDVDAFAEVKPFADLVAVNEGEASALFAAFGPAPAPKMVVTLGAQGAEYRDLANGQVEFADPIKVAAVDTTAAGDTFIGYFAAGLTEGLEPKQALTLANRAAALKVTRKGTAQAIPARAEVDRFI